MQYLFSERALKDIKKLEPAVQKRLVKKLDFLVGQKNPLRYAESIINSALGQYRFRVGDYRIIFDFRDEKLVILRLGHRKSIYK